MKKTFAILFQYYYYYTLHLFFNGHSTRQNYEFISKKETQKIIKIVQTPKDIYDILLLYNILY